MIPREAIIAASLHLEPDRAAILRDVYRAAARGIRHLAVNENMVALAMDEVRQAGLDLLVSGIVGYPIGQWVWQAKKVALDELAGVQNGPHAVMQAVGPWLDRTAGSAAEQVGITGLSGEVWLMTSLSAIPANRLEALADDVARCGASLLILSNGVAASGQPLPDATRIRTMAGHARGRFEMAAMAPPETPTTEISGWLNAGADKVICTDFWTLTNASSDNEEEST